MRTKTYLKYLVLFSATLLPSIWFRKQQLEETSWLAIEAKAYFACHNHVFTALVIELLLLSILASIIKKLLQDSQGFLVKIVGLFPAIIMCLWLITSWASWAKWYFSGSFLHQSDLFLSLFLLDISQLLDLLSAREILFALTIPLTAVTLVYFSCFFSKKNSSLKPKIFLLVTLLATNLIFIQNNKSRMSPNQIGQLGLLVNHYSLPSLSLFGEFLYDSSSRKIQTVNLDLVPANKEYSYSPSIPFENRPNIIFLVVEALRADVIGKKVEGQDIMPYLNKLSQTGLFFPKGYSQAADTGDSFTTLITGLYPLKDIKKDAHLSLDYPFTRIYDLLSESGYNSALLAEQWQVTRRVTDSPRLNLYFDPTISTEEKTRGQDKGHSAEETHRQDLAGSDEKKLSLIQDFVKESGSENKPVFAMAYLYSTHFPFNQNRTSRTNFQPTEISRIPGFVYYPDRLTATMQNRYWNCLNYLDEIIEKFARTLPSNTILLITGDHGSMFNEHGIANHASYLYEEAINVPIIFSSTANFKPRHTVSLPVGHIDLPPTILHLAGLEPHPNHQGQSLLREADQQAKPARTIYTTNQSITDESALIYYPFKLTRNYRGRGERLFNIASDPHERNQLKNPEVYEKLSEILTLFENKQLTYYKHLPVFERKNYFPPQHNSIVAVEKPSFSE